MHLFLLTKTVKMSWMGSSIISVLNSSLNPFEKGEPSCCAMLLNPMQGNTVMNETLKDRYHCQELVSSFLNNQSLLLPFSCLSS